MGRVLMFLQLKKEESLVFLIRHKVQILKIVLFIVAALVIGSMLLILLDKDPFKSPITVIASLSFGSWFIFVLFLVVDMLCELYKYLTRGNILTAIKATAMVSASAITMTAVGHVAETMLHNSMQQDYSRAGVVILLGIPTTIATAILISGVYYGLKTFIEFLISNWVLAGQRVVQKARVAKLTKVTEVDKCRDMVELDSYIRHLTYPDYKDLYTEYTSEIDDSRWNSDDLCNIIGGVLFKGEAKRG